MLNRLDEFPIHQTPEPIAHPATTDRNFYDRSWFAGFSADGQYYFGIAMACYPNRGIMDCAFSVVRKDGLQRSFYASRRMPSDRTDMSVGPFRIEIPDPMRRTRVILEDNDSGLACDLTFSARTGAIQEGRQTMHSGSRLVMDGTRFDLFGRWSGTISTPDGTIAVSADTCYGIKDRSWGVRRVGEPEIGGAPGGAHSAFFLWVPIFWENEITQAIIFDHGDGRPLFRDVLSAPLYAAEPSGPDVEDGMVKRFATARHRLTYQPGTRIYADSEIDLIDHDDTVRTLRVKPVLRFHMRGIGYGDHPEWGHAYWKGELATGSDSWDPKTIDPFDRSFFHYQQVVEVSDGSRTGFGVMEHIVHGAYAPYGITLADNCPK